MGRAEYVTALESLAAHPIKSPTVGGLLDLLPHLDPIQIGDLLTAGYKTAKSIQLPSVRVDGSFHVARFSTQSRGKLFLQYVKARTLASSYDQRASIDGGLVSENARDDWENYDFGPKTVEFARRNWGTDLVKDYWSSCLTFVVVDPSKMTAGEIVSSIPSARQVYVAINKSVMSIFEDTPKPKNGSINDAIVEITSSRVVRNELNGGFRGDDNAFYNCAFDGGPLERDRCAECGRTFPVKKEICQYDIPLPKKVSDFLAESGHRFGKDPELARRTEARKFKLE